MYKYLFFHPLILLLTFTTMLQGGDDVIGDYAPVSHVEITEHPTVATVLIVTWRQHLAVEGGWLEFSIDGGPWQASPERELAVGWQEELVLSAPADTPVEVRIMNRINDIPVSSEKTWTEMTGSLPSDLPEPRLVTYNPALAHPAEFLLVSINVFEKLGGYGLILNREGRIIWYRSPIGGHSMLAPRVARSGNHLLFDTDTYWGWGPYEPGWIRRVTIADEVLEEIKVPHLHHGWDERPDGTIVWGANRSGLAKEQLWAVDTDRNYWMIWDSQTWKVPGFVASNTCNWEEFEDTVILMFWSNASAVEIDFNTGEILRQFGAVPGSWSFDPPESQWDFAHGLNYTDEHTLIVSTHEGFGMRDEQLIHEYELDEANETLIEIWRYGEGEGLYAPTWGEAARLDNGNTVLNTGSNPLIREVTMDKETVWELRWGGDRVLGHMTYINTLSDLYALDGK